MSNTGGCGRNWSEPGSQVRLSLVVALLGVASGTVSEAELAAWLEANTAMEGGGE